MEALDKVLCVNDNEINLFILERLIMQSGVAKEVAIALNGKEGLDHYFSLSESLNEAVAPDLILLDIDMPVMNGWEFLENFTDLFLPVFPKTRVVITSSTIDDQEFEKAKNYPFIIDFRNTPMTKDYFQKLQLKIRSADDSDKSNNVVSYQF